MGSTTSKLTGVGLALLCAATHAGSQEKPSVIDLNAFVARGEIIANSDPLSAELRKRVGDPVIRRGFDIGMAATEGQTAWGPFKQRILNSLDSAGQEGFKVAASFSLDRNRNSGAAKIGAAIAEADTIVAQARTRDYDVRYWLGFDIASGIFGDPALGAAGNTATGPVSVGIRDSLSAPSQRGFNASVKLHFSRKYAESPVVTKAEHFGSAGAAGRASAAFQPENTVKVRVRYKKELGYKGDANAFGDVGPTSCNAFSVSAAFGSGRPRNPVRVSSDSRMEDAGGYYVCSYLVSDLPLDQTITIAAGMSSNSLGTEPWRGGSLSQPSPGQQRTIIIVSGRAPTLAAPAGTLDAPRRGPLQLNSVTLTQTQPRATLSFEMVYGPGAAR